MFFYLSAEVLRQGKAIIFENNARMVCIYPFFVVTLRAETELHVGIILQSVVQLPWTHWRRSIIQPHLMCGVGIIL